MQNVKQKFSLLISGAQETSHCGLDAMDNGKALGFEAAHHNCIVVAGATTGFPLWAAMGAKEVESAVTMAFSPAANMQEHTQVYQLTNHHIDIMIYTGFGYAGKDTLQLRTVDAVLVGCGRLRSIFDVTNALQDNKPVGVLEGVWGTDELIEELLNKDPHLLEKAKDLIIYDSDPRRLVEQIIKKIKQGQDN